MSDIKLKLTGLLKTVWPIVKLIAIPQIKAALDSVDNDDLNAFRVNLKKAINHRRRIPGTLRTLLCGREDAQGNFTHGAIDDLPLEATVEATKQRILDLVLGL